MMKHIYLAMVLAAVFVSHSHAYAAEGTSANAPAERGTSPQELPVSSTAPGASIPQENTAVQTIAQPVDNHLREIKVYPAF